MQAHAGYRTGFIPNLAVVECENGNYVNDNNASVWNESAERVNGLLYLYDDVDSGDVDAVNNYTARIIPVSL